MNDIKIPEKFDEDIKKSYMIFYTHRIVNEFMAYKNHLNVNEYNFDHIVNGATDSITLSDYEIKQVIKDCERILKVVYEIKIVNKYPITIEKVARW